MGYNEKNGIVGVDDLFSIGSPMNDTYQREEDILPTGKDGKRETPKGENAPEVIEDPEKPEREELKLEDFAKAQKANEQTQADEGNNKPTGGAEASAAKPVAGYRSVVDNLTKRGVFPSLKDVRFQSDDGTEIGYEDLKIDDENQLCDLIQTILENQKADLLEGKIDASKISEFTKKLIAADKAGANVVDILREYNATSAPVEKLDIENKADQIKIIKHYVSLLGLPKDDEAEYLNNILSRGDDFIEARALKYKAELDKHMDALIKKQTEEAEERRKADAEAFKRFKKDLKSSIQNNYQFTDTMVQKVLDFALKPAEENQQVSRAIETARQMLMDPQKAPDLLVFLMNPEEFIKQKSNRQVSEEKKRVFRMISNTNKTRNTAPVDTRGREEEGVKFDEISLDDVR